MDDKDVGEMLDDLMNDDDIPDTTENPKKNNNILVIYEVNHS